MAQNKWEDKEWKGGMPSMGEYYRAYVVYIYSGDKWNESHHIMPRQLRHKQHQKQDISTANENGKKCNTKKRRELTPMMRARNNVAYRRQTGEGAGRKSL